MPCKTAKLCFKQVFEEMVFTRPPGAPNPLRCASKPAVRNMSVEDLEHEGGGNGQEIFLINLRNKNIKDQALSLSFPSLGYLPFLPKSPRKAKWPKNHRHRANGQTATADDRRHPRLLPPMREEMS